MGVSGSGVVPRKPAVAPQNTPVGATQPTQKALKLKKA
jgi:hypothetical protein